MEQIGQKEGQKIKLCKVLFENESMDGMNKSLTVILIFQKN